LICHNQPIHYILINVKYYFNGRKSCINVIIPSYADREIIDSVIYNELCLGILKQSSKEKFKEIIRKLVSIGADGLILGCTEIPLLISQKDVEVPLFDTTTIHSKAAVEFALK